MSDILLKDERVLLIQPKLVEVLGLNEGLIIQQIHYWLNKSKHIIDGTPWIYNSYKEWQKQINFLSRNTIIRAIKRLEEMEILKSGNFNKLKIDRTKWYTIDYEKLYHIVENELSNCPERVIEETTVGKPIPKSTTKNTQIQIDNKRISTHNEFMELEEIYENEFNSITPIERKRLKKLYNIFPNLQVIKLAINEALKRGARNLRYVEKIIDTWMDKGLENEDDVRLFLQRVDVRRSRPSNNGVFEIDKGDWYGGDINTKIKNKNKWAGYKPPEPKCSIYLDDVEGIF